MTGSILCSYTLLAIIGHVVHGSFVTNIQPQLTDTSMTCIHPCTALQMTMKSNRPQEEITSRAQFITKSLLSVSLLLSLFQSRTNAFDGGVGGLGKSKPDTGVIFANADLALTSGGTEITTELLSPDRNTTALVSFYAPWPLLRSTTGIESRDLSNPEAAFVLVSPTTTTGVYMDASNIPPSFFDRTIFGTSGKFGMYGPVSDLKVKKVTDKQSSSIYLASFTTLTPAMRESERKAYITVSLVGNGVFMLITSSTGARFKTQEPLLRRIADSFSCVEAPKSKLRR